MPEFNPRPTITLPFQAGKRLNKKYSLVKTEVDFLSYLLPFLKIMVLIVILTLIELNHGLEDDILSEYFPKLTYIFISIFIKIPEKYIYIFLIFTSLI